jgi:ABC-type phosphate/phosphonate transport system substrate-binding protein
MSDPIKDGGMAVDMSVRDQFAEKFAVALIALSQLCKDENEMSENMRRTPGLAYELADAMLAEREKVLESARK